MTVIVHVWTRTRTHVGHAALTVGGAYMSYWPAGAADKKDVLKKRSHLPDFPTSYDEDRTAEDRRDAIDVHLVGLDEAAIAACWADIRATMPRYNLLRRNCATMVALLLERGSGKAASFKPQVPIAEWVPSPIAARTISTLLLRDRVCAWTPEQVLLYARELAAARAPA